jgi:SAM-dependent methyltransferase
VQVTPAVLHAPARELPDVLAGLLPPRYGYAMQDVFLAHARPLLQPDVAILDVGAGRSPSIAPAQRPPGCRYVGLDISERELRSAAPGAYDGTITHDITRALAPGERFDLVLSWQVLEHVKPVERALETLREALRPGGTMLAQLSGAFSAFALLARVVPHPVRVRAMARYLAHAEEEKFPTHYDHCWATALERMCASWSSVRLLAFYRGAAYFGMSRSLQRLYLGYESAVARREVRNLATHYLVIARR